MQSTPGAGSKFSLHLPFRLDASPVAVNDDGVEETSAMIFAAEKENLMEVRTLMERAGVITECELVDNEAGIAPLLQNIQRNRSYLDLVVFDLRHFEIDLDKLLRHDALQGLRVMIMHYDPGVALAFESGPAEFVSIINTSHKIARIIKRSSTLQHSVGGKDTVRTAQGKKVLLVDDNLVNLKLAGELIRLWGHEVCEAEHGEQAFEIFRREQFDLVILDIQMPDIDGVSLLQMMRDYAPEDKTPMVALTANVLNREADRLLQLGFDYFLGKPIDEAQFRALLDGKPRRRAEVDGDESSPNERELSFDYTRSLALCAGNLPLLRQILEILQRDIPEQRQQLADAFAEQDCDRLGTLAHKLQGVTCYASLPQLRRIVTALQQRLGSEQPTSLGRLMKQLDAELAAIAEQVDHHLQLLADRDPSTQDSSTAIATT
jgi:CheY-like chemotaxis protein